MDILAGILELFSSWKIGDKKKYSFIVSLISNALWISYSLYTWSCFGLLIVCCPASVINIRNYIKWSKDEKELSIKRIGI